MLHRINAPRLQFITDTVNLQHLQVLDVGCGGGILTESLAKYGAKVTGIDLAEALIRVAKQHAAANGLNIDYACVSAEDFALAHAAEFDVITCMEMLEHVPDPISVIKAMAEMLKPKGYLFLSTIDRSLMSFAKVIIAAEYLLRWLPRGTHHYSQFIRPEELSGVVREAGITPLELKHFSYHPLFNTFDLRPGPGANYLFFGQKLA
jgi:2-polyprenyl-6-hydroxyphenyl methylase/3-demethylubiquinone-9 3-methyltransferase